MTGAHDHEPFDAARLLASFIWPWAFTLFLTVVSWIGGVATLFSGFSDDTAHMLDWGPRWLWVLAGLQLTAGPLWHFITGWRAVRFGISRGASVTIGAVSAASSLIVYFGPFLALLSGTT